MVLRAHERLARLRTKAKGDDRAQRLEALKASLIVFLQGIRGMGLRVWYETRCRHGDRAEVGTQLCTCYWNPSSSAGIRS